MSTRKLYDKLIISYSTSYQISIVGQRYFRKGNSSTAQQCFIHLVNPNPAQAAALSTKTNFSDSKMFQIPKVAKLKMFTERNTRSACYYCSSALVVIAKICHCLYDSVVCCHHKMLILLWF